MSPATLTTFSCIIEPCLAHGYGVSVEDATEEIYQLDGERRKERKKMGQAARARVRHGCYGRVARMFKIHTCMLEGGKVRGILERSYYRTCIAITRQLTAWD